ncbi:MAG: hypothetical protein FJW88_00070 [Actinobacteria bacterium]|nr:hypothetical protein [Actinomycetota bacterium]
MDPAPVVTAPPVAKSKRQRKRKAAVAVTETETEPETEPDPVVRQSRVRVSKFDLWSVLKIALCFYLASVLVVVAAGVALWLIADGLGAIHDVEKFMGNILTSNNYRLVPVQILEGAALVGVVFVALATILTVVGAALYNLFAEVLGGFEVTLSESEPRR